MKFSLAHIYIAIVVLSFLCSLVIFRLRTPFHLMLFSLFLGITAITEIFANFVIRLLHMKSNFPIYNIFILIEYPLLAFYFKHVISSRVLKKIIVAFLFIYPVSWTIIFSFFLRLNEWNTYGVMAGDLFIIILGARYLYEIFTSEKLIDFRKSSEFWIAVSLVFFSCCELPITGILNFLEQDWNTTRQLLTILQLLNIIMYAIFIYAFLCRLNITKKL